MWVNGKIPKNCEGKVSFSVSNINSPAMISILAATYVAKRYVLLHSYFIKADILEEEKTQINCKV